MDKITVGSIEVITKSILTFKESKGRNFNLRVSFLNCISTCHFLNHMYVDLWHSFVVFPENKRWLAPNGYILKETKKSKAVQNSYETKKEIKKNKKDYTRASSHDDIKDLINFCS